MSSSVKLGQQEPERRALHYGTDNTHPMDVSTGREANATNVSQIRN
jgi:hypothetical protein